MNRVIYGLPVALFFLSLLPLFGLFAAVAGIPVPGIDHPDYWILIATGMQMAASFAALAFTVLIIGEFK